MRISDASNCGLSNAKGSVTPGYEGEDIDSQNPTEMQLAWLINHPEAIRLKVMK